MLVLLGGVMQVSAAKTIYLLSDVTTWDKNNVNDNHKFASEWDGTNTRDIHTFTINASNRNEDIYFRLWFNTWGNQICPWENKEYSFVFTNGQSEMYENIWYDNGNFQCSGGSNDKAFKIPHASIKASSYKITLYDYYNSNTINMKVEIVSMPVTISYAEKATFSCNRALDFTGTGINAYMITGANDGALTLSSAMTKVPANTGLYLEGAEDTYNVPVVTTSDASGVSTLDNMLVPGANAAVAAISGANTNFILTNKTTSGSAPLKFYKANNNTVPVGKAYLRIPTNLAGARDSFWFGDETTGIANVDVNAEFNANAPMYNLAGQRVSKNYKGVVIQNGKKMLMK